MSFTFQGTRVFVTGGAGFIGSHIVDRLLLEGARVTVYDNFSTGQEAFVAQHAGDDRLRIERGDVLDRAAITAAMAKHEFVFHLQANADVRGGIRFPRLDLEQNTIATSNVLEAVRENGITQMAFSSSATVYGDPAVFPTPEDYMPRQTSLYGASKLACEAMIEAYCEYFGITSYIFRFVSWIGERYTHGVIFDFMKKLRANPRELEILGDGRQRKSYLEVVDGVNGIFCAVNRASERKNLFNLGHHEFMNVMDVAAVVIDEMRLSGVTCRPMGGDRGWLGDAPFVHLDTRRITALGWRAEISISDGIRRTVRYLAANPNVLERRPLGGL